MDYLTDYAVKSTCAYLEAALSGLYDAKQVTTNFNWDYEPDPANPGNKERRRNLPFAGVNLIKDRDDPFSQGNILYDREILIHIELCCRNHTELVRMTSSLRQALLTATNSETGGIGLTLYNYSSPSGVYYANAGTMQIEVGASQYFGTEKTNDINNRQYLSITPVELTAFKDATATLLENMGRVNLSDS